MKKILKRCVNPDTMTVDEMKAFISAVMIVTNRIYVSAELGSRFCGNHPSILKQGMECGAIRIEDNNSYKRKHPVNVWDCLKLAQL